MPKTMEALLKETAAALFDEELRRRGSEIERQVELALKQEILCARGQIEQLTMERNRARLEAQDLRNFSNFQREECDRLSKILVITTGVSIILGSLVLGIIGNAIKYKYFSQTQKEELNPVPQETLQAIRACALDPRKEALSSDPEFRVVSIDLALHQLQERKKAVKITGPENVLIVKTNIRAELTPYFEITYHLPGKNTTVTFVDNSGGDGVADVILEATDGGIKSFSPSSQNQEIYRTEMSKFLSWCQKYDALAGTSSTSK